MEKKFDIENFENFLRDVTDEFRLYPSKRVWHSIYNDMHPSKKWPSITISIFLVATMLFLGFLNSNNNQVLSYKPDRHTNNATRTILLAQQHSEGVHIHSNTINLLPKLQMNDELGRSFNTSKSNINIPTTVNKQTNLPHIPIAFNTAISFSKKNKTVEPTIINEPSESTIEIHSTSNVRSNQTNNRNNKNNTPVQNDLIPKKEKNKLSWQVYASPSIIQRTSNDRQTASVATDDGTIDNNDNFNASSLGVEVGATMKYNLLKSLRLTTGLQLNYSKYNIDDLSASSNWANKSSLSNFNPYSNIANPSNETYQISIPVGVEFKVAGKNQLNWNIGATIQPTFVMGGKAYSISADRTNLSGESSLMSNWNLNAGFETFISYKLSGLTWQIGPQFRYQILSTYSKNYSIVENLSNYGLKVGVSKQIK
jgi:hypothetical protein